MNADEFLEEVRAMRLDRAAMNRIMYAAKDEDYYALFSPLEPPFRGDASQIHSWVNHHARRLATGLVTLQELAAWLCGTGREVGAVQRYVSRLALEVPHVTHAADVTCTEDEGRVLSALPASYGSGQIALAVGAGVEGVRVIIVTLASRGWIHGLRLENAHRITLTARGEAVLARHRGEGGAAALAAWTPSVTP